MKVFGLRLVIVSLCAFLLFPNVTADLQTDIESKITDMWKFEDNLNSTMGAVNFTATGTINYVTAKLGKGVNIDLGEYLSSSDKTNEGTGDYTILCWVNPDSVTNYPTILDNLENDDGFELRKESGGGIRFTSGEGGSYDDVTGTTAPNVNSWELWGGMKNGSNIHTIYNNSFEGTVATTGYVKNTQDFYIGIRSDLVTTTRFDGVVDDCILLNDAINQTALDFVYNNGAGVSFLVTTNYYLAITALDNTTDSSINNFNSSVYFLNGTLLYTNTTSTGTINFNMTNDIISNYTVTFSAEDYKDLNKTVEWLGTNVNYQFKTVPVPSVNFTFYDEISKTPINNVSYQLIFDDAAINGSTTNGYVYIELNNTGDLEIVYDADDYFLRKYFINITKETDAVSNLYLLNESADNVAEISYLVTDQSGVNLEDAKISALRRYVVNGVAVYEVVEMSESNVNGQGSLHLEKLNPDYKFLITYNGETVLLTGDNQIFENSIIFKATIGVRITETLYELNSLVYDLDYDNYSFELIWSDSSAVIDEMCLNVYRYLSTGRVLINSSCSSSSTGGFDLGIGGTIGTYEAIVSATVDGNNYLIATLNKKLDNIAANIEVEGLFWTAIFVVVAATVGVFSPVVSIIFTVMALIISSMIGLASIGQGSLIFIGSIAGFIIYSFRRGGA